MMILGFIAVALIGLALGFVGGRFYSEKTTKTAQLQQQLSESQQQMTQYRADVSANLAVTEQLITEMKSNYDNIVEQMNKTTKLLEQPSKQSDPNLQYFGYDATRSFLDSGQNSGDKKRQSELLDSQPSDYSGSASGLFDNADANKALDSESIKN